MGDSTVIFENGYRVVLFYLEVWWSDVWFEGRLVLGIWDVQMRKLWWSVVLRGFRLLLQSLRGSAKAWRIVMR